jgi:hypothetical protein
MRDYRVPASAHKEMRAEGTHECPILTKTTCAGKKRKPAKKKEKRKKKKGKKKKEEEMNGDVIPRMLLQMR